MYYFFIWALLTTSAHASGSLYVTISLFWEGSDIKQHNLDALQKLRSNFPQLKINHFISPVYFLDPEQRNSNLNKFRSALKEQDQVGLLLSPQKPITDKAGILLRNAPSFWGQTEKFCDSECGASVPLTVYSSSDIEKIFDASIGATSNLGISFSKSFATSGWQYSKAIAEVAAKKGFKYDWSAIPPSRIVRRLHNFPIYNWTKDTWSQFEKSNQPRRIKTTLSPMIVIPQSGGVVDYNTSQELLSFYKETLAQVQTSGTIYNLAVHQETCATFLPRIIDAMNKIFSDSKEKGTSLTFDWSSYRNTINPN